MPDLKNSYLYKDWILDLSQAEEQHNWSRFDLYHQCVYGTICRSKGVLKPIAPEEPVTLVSSQFYTGCAGCGILIPPDVEQQMHAMWNLLTR